MSLQIRPLDRTGIDTALDWAAREGWNPGLHDADSFAAADPGAFLGLWRQGELASVISAVRYGEAFGFIGFYIARPDRRGQGLGLALWQAAMARLGTPAGRTIGLDGVVAQQDNYRRSGFHYAYANVRHQGVVPAGLADKADAVVGIPSPADPHATATAQAGMQDGIHPLARLPFKAVLAYDTALFPAPREAFLRAWVHQIGSTALGLVEQCELRGYGVLRPCRAGHKVGPLFADTSAHAERLLLALLATLPAGSPVQFDVPAPNTAATALAARLGLAPAFETARMYTGPAPAIDLARVHGVTSFELG